MLIVNKDECTGCGQCVSKCPVDAIEVIDDIAHIYHYCIGCGECQSICPESCITESKEQTILKVNELTCNGCGTCVDNCPASAIRLVVDKAQINPVECINCELCVENCPTNSIQ